MRGIMLFAMPLSVRLDSSDYGHPLHADVVASKEYGFVFRKYGNVMRAGVTPPVIPWFFQESLDRHSRSSRNMGERTNAVSRCNCRARIWHSPAGRRDNAGRRGVTTW